MIHSPNPHVQRINLLTSKIDNAYHEAALRFGLSDSAMIVLYAVCCEGESCPLSEIVRGCGLSKQTVNSALRRLEADGIVCLRPSGGRTKQVCLTGQGLALCRNTVSRLIQIENEIFDSWPPEDAALYLDLMQRYLSAFEEKSVSL